MRLLERGVSLVLALVLLSASAEARLFGKDKPEKPDPAKQVETYQPPPVGAVDAYCEPLREKAIDIKQKPVAARIFLKPRRARLIRKHRKCKETLMVQEFDYLKHVDIQRSPSLPRLKLDAPAAPESVIPPEEGSDDE